MNRFAVSLLIETEAPIAEVLASVSRTFEEAPHLLQDATSFSLTDLDAVDLEEEVAE